MFLIYKKKQVGISTSEEYIEIEEASTNLFRKSKINFQYKYNWKEPYKNVS